MSNAVPVGGDSDVYNNIKTKQSDLEDGFEPD